MESYEYYTVISNSYESLYGAEQRKKISGIISIIGIKDGDSILDIGAGNGILEKILHENDILAVEPSSLFSFIPVNNHIKAENKRISDFSTNRKFDVVMCVTVLQDLNEEERKICIEKAFEYCKPGGRIAISVLKSSGIDLDYLKPRIITEIENDRVFIFYKTEKV
ncbi:class I SAM-dependent methyltransferase [Candidatus Parvarchaeota archaeon]|nr:class I SAM-dependent methyltransferase [Candidatus Parvarchaeota archaeon]